LTVRIFIYQVHVSIHALNALVLLVSFIYNLFKERLLFVCSKRLFREAKADAKIRLLSDTLQILEQLFKKFFFFKHPEEPAFQSTLCLSCKAGAKVEL